MAGLSKDGYVWNGASVDGNGVRAFGPFRLYQEVVDASAGGTAQAEVLCTVPAGSMIVDVRVEILEAFDGDTTTTMEVGTSGDSDLYIDTLDFNPAAAVGTEKHSFGGTNNDTKVLAVLSAAEALQALWTNTANATAGKVLVQVLWIELGDMGR